ncbi:hypothetical protein JKF63_04254 [Porcisia hertigi]|uniref:Uncharacterized protein n=1 Tax=Porcisia hertigi TaxID=2761500 RepID=A0A836LHF8_9TRYP|nr:hypothetical protein JKF63_04254 [Porcisia hertigi]
MKELSNRQWRALAQAYPFYLTEEAGVGGAAVDSARGRQADLTHGNLLAPSLSSNEEFVLSVVPRVSKIFPEELQAYERGRACCAQQGHLNADGLSPTSSCTAAEAVDALLRYLFDSDGSAHSKDVSTEQHKTVAFRAFAPLVVPLSRREIQLLGLYHRKQEQYAHVLSNQQQLLAASQVAVKVLQEASGPLVAEAPSGERATQRGAKETLASPTCDNLIFLDYQKRVSSWPLLATTCPSCRCNFAHAAHPEPSDCVPGLSSVKGGDASPTFTSVLAGIPYEGHPRETPAAATMSVGVPSVTGTPSTSLHCHAEANAAPALFVVNRCVGCQEVGGDLLVCTQCGEIRHEACGGPHPPEVSQANGRMPTVNACKRCAKELNLSSSSSSLRSSTSTSERAELDEYFGTEDDDSSLSGFIVNTSDDEKAEEDSQSAGDDGGGSDADMRAGNARGEVRHCRHRSKKTLSLSPRKGQHVGKSKKTRSSTAAASDAASTSSGESSSSLGIWSRAASLDRALAGGSGKKNGNGSTEKRRAGNGSVGDMEPPRKGRERKRGKRRRRSGEGEEAGRRRRNRKRSGGDATDASLTSSTSLASSSSLTKETQGSKARKGNMPSQHQSSTQGPLSPAHQECTRQEVLSPASKKGTVGSSREHCRTEPLSAPPASKLMMLEDEEELSALGIASSSTSATPLHPSPPSSKRRQGGIANRRAGRKSVMNIGTSSFSSEDSD